MANSAVVILLIAVFVIVAKGNPMKPKTPLAYFKCANLEFAEESDSKYVQCKELKNKTEEEGFKLRQKLRKYLQLLDQINKTKERSGNSETQVTDLITQSQSQYEDLLRQIKSYDIIAEELKKILSDDYFVYKLEAKEIQAPPAKD
jgi:hypothetical protein